MDFVARHREWLIAFGLALFLVLLYQGLFAAPQSFMQGTVVTIERGASASLVAEELYDAHIIGHPSLFRLWLQLSGTSGSVQAGAYRFLNGQNVFVVAERLATGDFGFKPVRITFTEGTTVREAAILIAGALPEVSASNFVKAAKAQEGYLFPDTYLFSTSFDAPGIIAMMRANFDAKIATLSDSIHASGRSLSDIVTLASLVEKEARTLPNRRIVAGILLNRLRLHMPLQTDVVFGYIFNRDTYAPSVADLTVDSPYNTYTHTGLPPGPIDNPGYEALDAATNPTKTNYLYYLTGDDGLMHYATTYAGHQANQIKYLP